MRTAVAALLAALALPAAAVAQDVDGWDVQVDPARDLTVAGVQYAGGSALAVQCQQGVLRAVVLGLPVLADDGSRLRELEVGFDAAALEKKSWSRANDTAAVNLGAGATARLARRLKRGGVFIVRAPGDDGRPTRLEMPLPSDSSGVNQVLQACGVPVFEPRDDLAEANDLLVGPNWVPRPLMAGVPWAENVAGAEVEIGCLIASEGRIADCRVESERPHDQGVGAEVLADTSRVRLNFGDNAAAAVGRVIFIKVSGGTGR